MRFDCIGYLAYFPYSGLWIIHEIFWPGSANRFSNAGFGLYDSNFNIRRFHLCPDILSRQRLETRTERITVRHFMVPRIRRC